MGILIPPDKQLVFSELPIWINFEPAFMLFHLVNFKL
jgi:hypothetical protein